MANPSAPAPVVPDPALLTEIKAVGGHHAIVADIKTNAEELTKHLKHVETVDKSSPVVEPNVHVQKWDKDGFLKEIESPPQLKHVDHIDDRSTPVIEPTTSLKLNEHDKLLQEISSPHALKHVETVDKSAPKISKSASLKVKPSGEVPSNAQE